MSRGPSLTPEEAATIRRLRTLPPATRPRVADLAARFGTHTETIRKVLRGLPPYDGAPSLPRFARARDARYDEPGWSGEWNFTGRRRRKQEQAEESIAQIVARPVWSHRIGERRR